MRLRHLTLFTHALPRLAAFYADTLGLRAQTRSATELTLAVGPDRLTFRAAAPGTTPFYHFAFEVAADSVQGAGAWLAGAAPLLPFEGADLIDFPNWQAQSVYLRDPAGNIVECIGRRPRGLPAAATPFSAADLHGLSEIGVVVPDVSAFAAALTTAHGLPYFERQPAAPRFTTLGDDTGLLIVVPPDRAWFPTTDAISAEFPLVIELEPRPGATTISLRLP